MTTFAPIMGVRVVFFYQIGLDKQVANLSNFLLPFSINQ